MTSDPQNDQTNPAPDWFLKYLQRGFHLVAYERGKKGPEGSSAIDWTNPAKQITSPKQWQPNKNWGVFLGTEIQPQHYLIDLDFDWQTKETQQIANKLLPDTKFTFGRASKYLSHAFYTIDEPLARQTFEDITDEMLLELRGTTDGGGIGWQTMIPPSVHPSGETIEWRQDKEITHLSAAVLLRRIQLYAATCLIIKHLGPKKVGHDVRLALAGFFLQEGLTEDETTAAIEAIVNITQNDVSDVRFAVRSTLGQIKKQQNVKGAGTLAQAIGAQGPAVIRRLQRFFGAPQFHESKKGIIPNSQHNIRVGIQRLHIELGFNEFSQQLFAVNSRHDHPQLLDDSILIPLRLQLDSTFHFLPSKDFFVDCVKYEAWKHPMHPVRDYLNTLKWDQVPRIDTWLIQHAHAEESDYTRAVSALVLIAAVRRIRQPGCKFDEMLILESAKQGTLKSSALATLCPNDDWFSDDLPLGADAKQVIERTAGKWIIEASELHGHRKSEAEHIKAFLSNQSDGPVRLAYDRMATEVRRQFIIIGTTNMLTGYLKDSSGARRFWPVKIDQFNVENLRADRDQLWAEAAHREAQGESIRLRQELWEDAEIQQEHRRAVHPWEEILTTSEDIDLTGDQVLVSKVWTILGVTANQRNNMHASVVTEIMQRHGFTRKVRKYGQDEGEEHTAQQWFWVKQ